MLDQKNIDKIIKFAKKEPCTIQDIAKLINKSWVTADSYVNKIIKETGELQLKVFRKGTQGAIKVVYYNYGGALDIDDYKKHLLNEITHGRQKIEFDFMDIYQNIPQKNKKAKTESNIRIFEKYLIKYLEESNDTIMCMSGNLSFLSEEVIEAFEKALSRKVQIKLLCRINMGSIKNISPLKELINKYPETLEIKHRFHPLRGFIIDKKAIFREEEKKVFYRKGEITNDTQIIYEIFDQEWIDWLRQTFWKIYRNSSNGKTRIKEIEKIM